MGTTTTSKIGDPAAGFTLLEILLALAVIGLLSAVLIGGSARLLATKPLTPDDVFWKAVGQARKDALERGHETHLAFDTKTKAFQITDSTGAAESVPFTNPPQELVAEFLPGGDAPSSAALLGGSLVETQTIPSVTFYADGTCMPFRAQIRSGVGAHVIKIDPWTCAKILTPLNPDGTPVLTPN
jgi:prepilin-type N-terminal cleavage/methylation domain-containing protein